MKATKIHEFSNGGIVAKLGNRNVYMISSTPELWAVWSLPPYDLAESLDKNEVEWTDDST